MQTLSTHNPRPIMLDHSSGGLTFLGSVVVLTRHFSIHACSDEGMVLAELWHGSEEGIVLAQVSSDEPDNSVLDVGLAKRSSNPLLRLAARLIGKSPVVHEVGPYDAALRASRPARGLPRPDVCLVY